MICSSGLMPRFSLRLVLLLSVSVFHLWYTPWGMYVRFSFEEPRSFRYEYWEGVIVMNLKSELRILKRAGSMGRVWSVSELPGWRFPISTSDLNEKKPHSFCMIRGSPVESI